MQPREKRNPKNSTSLAVSMPQHLIFCDNQSSLNSAGATFVGRIQLGSAANAIKRGKILLGCSEASLPGAGSTICGVLRLAAGSSFDGLAEISAQLDGRMSCVVEKMLDFTITMYFHKSGLRSAV